MKTQLIVTLVAVSFVFACGKKDEDKGKKQPAKPAVEKKEPAAKPEPKPAATLEMAPIDIVYEDFKAVMDAPKGSVFKESFGTLEVKLGDGKDFFVQIDTDAPDMAEIKKEIEGNDVQKLVKFHTENDTTFVYETEAFGKKSFWLDMAVKVGDKTVHCYSGRGANSYTLEQIQTFEKACASLKPKE